MLIFFIAVILVILGFLIGSGYLFITTVRRSDSSAKATKMSGGTWDKHRELLGESREWLNAAKCEKLHIKSFDGLTLAGYYYPAENCGGCLVMAFNGYRSDSRGQYSHITRYLNGLGIDVVLVDDRAHGESKGKYVGFGVLDRYDCKLWAEYIDKKFGGERKIYLYGVSMGAASVLMAGALDLPATVKGIIADCGFTSTYDVFKHVLNSWYHLPAFPLLNISDLMCRAFAGYGYKDADAVSAVKSSALPLLVIHGEKDTFVPAYMAPMIYEASASKHKRLLIVKNAEHAESYFIDMQNYRKTITDFIRETQEI